MILVSRKARAVPADGTGYFQSSWPDSGVLRIIIEVGPSDRDRPVELTGKRCNDSAQLRDIDCSAIAGQRSSELNYQPPLSRYLMIEVRPGHPDDIATIVEFNAQLAWETERKQLDRQILNQGVARALAHPEVARYFVACREGRVVGQLMHTWEWSDWRNGFWWWIQSVYVAAEFRRQGVFRTLLRRLEQEAQRASDVVGLRLYVETHNELAQQVYHHLGFDSAEYLVREKRL